MKLKQLETFYWVCQLGGIVAAAERLNATQSTVSARIQELEAVLGLPLLDRSQRSVRPTPKGIELLGYVEQVLSLTSEIEQRLADPEVLTGSIRLGVTELVAVTWLSQLLAAINERYPSVKVELLVDLTNTHVRKLAGGELDLALIPGPAQGLGQLSLGFVEFAWMASPKLGIPRKLLSPRDLSRWPMLTLTREAKLHHLVASWFEQNGAAMPRADMCNSIGLLSVLTAAGLGLSFLPFGYFTDDRIRTGELSVVRTSPTFRPFEYSAIFDSRRPQQLVLSIAKLAQTHSTFSEKPSATRERPSIIHAVEGYDL